MIALLVALATALPPPLTDAERAELRCVAVLAVVAEGQRQGGWRDVPAAAEVGRTYAGIVGDAGVAAGRTLESERNLMLEAATALRRTPPSAAEARGCIARAGARIAAEPPLPVPSPSTGVPR